MEQARAGGQSRIVTTLLLSLAMMAVAACSTPRPKAAPVVAAPPPVLAEAPKAVVPVAASQHRVALLVPVTGANAAVGQSIANAANLALADLGEKRIKLTVYDTAPGAAGAASRAVADGAAVFLGPLLAPDVRAVEGVAKAAGVPVITFSNDATLAGGGTYVLGFQTAESINRVVAYARSRGVERFAALIPVGVYGQRASAAFVKAVQSSGGKVTGIETFARDRAKLTAAVRRITDYETRVARAAQAGMVRQDGTVAPVQSRLGPVSFQALLIADGGAVATAFLPPLTQFGAGPAQAKLLGTELWNSEPGLAARPGMQGAWFASVTDGRFSQLATRYRARFGGQPSRLASLGYDSVLLVGAIAGRWTVGAPFPRAALGDEDGFAGIDGIFRFKGGVAERGLEVQEARGGSFVAVSPAPKAFRP